MSSELSEQKPQQPARLQNMANRPSEPEHLPCPRCESTNTKFCYYNNYNLSQPRHFCKSCRRYWTRGGTLRNVPVGGVSRKSNKRSRTTSPTVSSTAAAGPSTSSSSSTVTTNDLLPAEPVKHENGFGSGSPFCGMVNLNEAAAEDFGSFFKGQQQGGGSFMPLGYFGYGSGLGLGSGFGTWDWPSEQVVEGGDNGGVMSGAASTWQLGCGGEGGLADGDCYGWSDLAISAPVQSLK